MDNITIAVKENCIFVNDIVEELFNFGVMNLENSAISFFEPEMKVHVFCGVIPNVRNVSIPIKILETNTKTKNQEKTEKNENKRFELAEKLRFIPPKSEKIKMDLIEEEHEHTEENNSGMLGKKSRRSKERKLGYIIEKVFLWRKLFNGWNDEKKGFVKLTLEDAAQKVGISKKSLDDYLNQLK